MVLGLRPASGSTMPALQALIDFSPPAQRRKLGSYRLRRCPSAPLGLPERRADRPTVAKRNSTVLAPNKAVATRCAIARKPLRGPCPGLRCGARGCLRRRRAGWRFSAQAIRVWGLVVPRSSARASLRSWSVLPSVGKRGPTLGGRSIPQRCKYGSVRRPSFH